MKSLNIIGTGNVGQSLGRLFHQQHIFQIKSLYNRRVKISQKAAEFIGAGDVVNSLTELSSADVTLITVPDTSIHSVAIQLTETGLLRKGDIVLHCSGALSSEVFEGVTPLGVLVASVHPALSFAEPLDKALDCYCTLEGNKKACESLAEPFRAIGANLMTITSEDKVAYHTALVTISNHLVALLSCGIEQLEKLTIMPDAALQMIKPLVEQCVRDVFSKGPALALTGPVERGDWETVESELDFLRQTHQTQAELYRLLAMQCVELVKQKREIPNQTVIKILTKE